MAKDKKEFVRTYPVKGLVIFLSIVIGVSAAFAVANFFLLKDMLAFQIIIWILCAFFIVVSLIVLLKEALTYLYFDDENKVVVIHEVFSHKKIPLDNLKCIENKDGFYIFYQGKKEVYRIGTERLGADKLMVVLEKNGANIKW